MDLEKICEASKDSQTEQQSQIVSLHSRIRELRGVLDEAEVERALLQKARRALQAELESMKTDLVDGSQEWVDESTKKAETNDHYRHELGKLRMENTKLDKVNVSNETRL